MTYRLEVTARIRRLGHGGSYTNDQLSVEQTAELAPGAGLADIGRVLQALDEFVRAWTVEEASAEARAARGRDAYVAYANRVGWVSVRGEPLPPWDALGENDRDGWTDAAHASPEVGR